MIAPLRKRHRFITIALALSIPPLVFLAISSTPPVPSGSIPAELESAAVDGEPQQITFSFHKARIIRTANRLSLLVDEPLRSPDVLAYLSSTAAEAGAALPQDARLLGPVSHGHTNSYELQASADGYLLLYSLGHQTMVDSAPLKANGGAR